MKLRPMPGKTSLKGKHVLLRVDWNLPLEGPFAPEDSLKLDRSHATIDWLSRSGAVAILLTHVGRPKGRDLRFSTEKLARLAHRATDIPIHFLGANLGASAGIHEAKKTIEHAKPGTVFLCENVRFLKGEETNAPSTAKTLASLGDLFVNDAFASCHRAHASVVGIAKFLPSFAGPSLVEEVHGLERLIAKPKRPFVAVIGGAKLSTKIGVLKSLLDTADRVLVGGAMAHAFFKAMRMEIGRSFLEKESVTMAKTLLKHPKLVLPRDVLVATALKSGVPARSVPIAKVRKTDVIGDIGTETMMAWAKELKTAKTIMWNGPVGVAEIPTFAHGSLLLARVIAARSKGPTYGVIGGGDTLPIVMQSGMSEWVDHLSTGGGAMLEFLALKGELPGLIALEEKKTRAASKKKKV
ncbi:phosphoglycerate kinase [Candidatus Uhrbacteria bacterium]|nr:phosphoglycerate kinase [Candidatus Uhrbacteria bacterium]